MTALVHSVEFSTDLGDGTVDWTLELSRYGDEFEWIRGQLGLRSWAVRAQSFGAGIAIRYALAHPDAVWGLVLTNSRSALNDVRATDDPPSSLE